MRVNHNGTRMDKIRDDAKIPGTREEVLPTIEKVHVQGTGVLGMKIMGEGAFVTP